jgi:hypothetical protein
VGEKSRQLLPFSDANASWYHKPLSISLTLDLEVLLFSEFPESKSIINYSIINDPLQPHEQFVASECEPWIHLDTFCSRGTVPLDLSNLDKVFGCLISVICHIWLTAEISEKYVQKSLCLAGNDPVLGEIQCSKYPMKSPCILFCFLWHHVVIKIQNQLKKKIQVPHVKILPPFLFFIIFFYVY